MMAALMVQASGSGALAKRYAAGGDESVVNGALYEEA